MSVAGRAPSRRPAVLVVIVLTAGCASAPTSVEPTPTGAASTPAPSASAASTSVAAAPVEPTVDVGELTFAISGAERFSLLAVDDAVFAIEQDGFTPRAKRIDDATIAAADSVFATFDLGPPIPGTREGRHFRVLRMRGKSDGDLDLTFETEGGSMNRTADAHRRSGKWTTGGSYPDVALLPLPTWALLPDGRVIRVDYEKPTVFTEESLDGRPPKPGSWLPVATAAGAAVGCATRIAAYEKIGVLDGRLLAIGPTCAGAGAYAVETWTIGKAGSSVEVLPGAPSIEWSPADLVSIAGATIVSNRAPEGAAKPYVARFDGKSWTDLSPPKGTDDPVFLEVGGKLHALFAEVGYRRDGDAWTTLAFPARLVLEEESRSFVARDGVVWAILDGRLYRLAVGGTAFERVKLPSPPGGAPLFVDAVAFTPGGKPVVAVSYDAGHAVLLPAKR